VGARRPRSPRPGERRAASPRARPDRALEARIDAVVASTGLPRDAARRVVRGEATANDLLARMAREDHARLLERHHGLPHALAMQVAMGHADLARILERRRCDARLARDRDWTGLVAGTHRFVVRYGHVAGLVRVERVGTYEVVLRATDGEPEEVHKTALVYACDPDDQRRVRNAVAWDPARRAAAAPALRPQDRWGVPDRRLAALAEAETPVRVALAEGEVLTGVLTRAGRYEVELLLRGGARVAIFRHAMVGLHEAATSPPG
jgi:sRNA-binding regulator protein Hfq